MALTTPNMGLTAWNNLTDLFSHSQLKSNFDLIDAHDHTDGKGPRIGAGALAAASVGATELQTNAVATGAIQDGAVTNPKLAANAVTAAKVAAGAVTKAALDAGVRQDTGLFHGYRVAAYSGVTSGTDLVFDGQIFDISNWFSQTTGLWTCGLTGYYWFGWSVGLSNATQLSADNYALAFLTLNGSTWKNGTLGLQRGTALAPTSSGATVISLTSGDTIGVRLQHNQGGGIAVAASAAATWFAGHLLTV